jgi:threonine dehydratase
LIPREWFGLALDRIAPHIVRTPLTHDAARDVFLKWENRQVTGSFKARGALNKILGLEPWERDAGLVAASAGNHGQGVALAAGLAGAKAEIFVPAHAVAAKVDAIRALGAEVHLVEGGYGETEAIAKAHASEAHRTFISPYNDGQVIAGQGTVALEVVRQLIEEHGTPRQESATWIVPASGGGLICGCATALAGDGPRPRMIGVQPSASPFTYNLYHHGTQEGSRDDPTLADGLSGAIDENSITMPMLRELVDDIVLVSEEAIERAIAFAWWTYGEKLEGSAAAALAAFLDGAAAAGPCVIVLTGGNIQGEVFDDILKRYPEPATP